MKFWSMDKNTRTHCLFSAIGVISLGCAMIGQSVGIKDQYVICLALLGSALVFFGMVGAAIEDTPAPKP